MSAVSISKERLGAIGETLVSAKLMEHGWDAFNANLTINNYKSTDIVCVRQVQGKSPETVFVQVKTTQGKKDFPVGFSIQDCISGAIAEKVRGPWVFVHAKGDAPKMEYDYYILTATELVDVLKKAQSWYRDDWKRANPIKDTSAASMCLKWLQAIKDERAGQPTLAPILNASALNQWDKIWE